MVCYSASILNQQTPTAESQWPFFINMDRTFQPFMCFSFLGNITLDSSSFFANSKRHTMLRPDSGLPFRLQSGFSCTERGPELATPLGLMSGKTNIAQNTWRGKSQPEGNLFDTSAFSLWMTHSSFHFSMFCHRFLQRSLGICILCVSVIHCQARLRDMWQGFLPFGYWQKHKHWCKAVAEHKASPVCLTDDCAGYHNTVPAGSEACARFRQTRLWFLLSILPHQRWNTPRSFWRRPAEGAACSVDPRQGSDLLNKMHWLLGVFIINETSSRGINTPSGSKRYEQIFQRHSSL